ncbi:MAG: hypothetical protein LBK97_05005 [Prevotellaceae bacterium]|jgi:glycerol uptake facilitator-like aquaporin|nr:hypothetical protein [Prevotellaceae bacterium]
MNTNDLKEMWKSRIDGNIQDYSQEELSGLVVKSARMSMKAIQPNIITRLFLGAVTVILIWRIATEGYSVEMDIMYVAVLLLVLVCCIFVERAAYIMNKYNPDVSVKEWLEYRIRQVEKSINYRTKYSFLMYGSALISGCVAYSIVQLLHNVSFNWISIVIFISLFVLILVIRYIELRQYNKTLAELKELYRQLEE